MREILFKAKRKDNGEWVEGFYAKGSTRHCILPHLGGYPKWDVDENTICQYTGLTDKNGNKIWENDVVKDVDGSIGKILYGENIASFLIYYENVCHEIALGKKNISMLDIEVIGNIFDNPELLEGGAE